MISDNVDPEDVVLVMEAEENFSGHDCKVVYPNYFAIKYHGARDDISGIFLKK
jgi:hypothetical protein